MPDLVVVGAGPVGSLLALMLARQGHAVDVYERRPALRACLAGSATQDVLSSGYKELTMPPREGGFAMHRNALHIWPRGNFMLIALPNSDGSFTCTLFLPFEGSPSFAELVGEEDAARFFEKWFPDAVPLIPGLAAQFMQAPLGRMA